MSHHWHANVGIAWCPCDEDQDAPGVPTPAAPDTTGELREAIAEGLLTATTDYGTGKAAPEVDLFDFYADAVLALPALRDLLAERDKLAAQRQAAREVHPRHRIGDFDEPCAICRALGTPTTGGGE